jgi:hypothetical protein
MIGTGPAPFGAGPPAPVGPMCYLAATLTTSAWDGRQGTGYIMAVAFYFAHDGFTPEKYAQAISKLEAAGAGAPKGRTQHVALESDGLIQVFDIWESQADFDAFGPVVMATLSELGVALNPPMVANVHNVIKG